jgi:co-chaperonin GroES (HSP10)
MTRVTSFKPTGLKVLVEPIYDAPKVGRILVPDAHREERPQEATVVALGPKAKLDVKVGDRVLTDAFAGTLIEINGKKHRLLEPGDVLALVEQAI